MKKSEIMKRIIKSNERRKDMFVGFQPASEEVEKM